MNLFPHLSSGMAGRSDRNDALSFSDRYLNLLENTRRYLSATPVSAVARHHKNYSGLCDQFLAMACILRVMA